MLKVKKFGRFLNAVLPSNVQAITLAPFGIYLRADYYGVLNNGYAAGPDNNLINLAKYEDYEIAKVLVNHETIHWQQQIEMGILPFYIWYALEWFIKYITPPVGAYEAISFEREAYAHESDYYLEHYDDDYIAGYLATRPRFAWFKYIKKGQWLD